MAEYQITSWQDIPSMVVARDGDDVTKVQLSSRFQEAIDEAAMRLGQIGSDQYLEGWRRSEWASGAEDHADMAHRVAHELDETWSDERIKDYLDALGTATS